MDPRWLRLKQAAEYSAIGRRRLVRLAKAGKVRGFQDKESKLEEWVFDRQSLDDYRMNQLGKSGPDKRALDILESLR